MGSWSVYCGISQIAITAGQKCVLLPLKKSNSYDSYLPYLPATLPIFGTYDDYGGVEDIEEDDNTKLIEEHFGVNIAEFVVYFVDGKHTYQRSEYEEVKGKMKNLEECEDWRFMFIDRNVYDFMIKNHNDHAKGYFDLGTPEMLKLFGFEQVEGAECKNYDPKRFNQLWQKGKVKVYSDGGTLLAFEGGYIHYIGHGGPSSLEHYIEIPEELQYLKECTASEVYKINKKNHKTDLGWIIGNKKINFVDGLSSAWFKAMQQWSKEKNGVMPSPTDFPDVANLIHEKYCTDVDNFGDKLVELINIRGNMHAMSGYFAPYVLYLTPQCGEYEHHQILLDEFSKINKEYIAERDAH